jgi:uncharacterized protein YdhG (YjbR/CyaY superfamily)
MKATKATKATKSTVAKDVDAYLKSVPEPARSTLTRLRRDIKAAAPGAAESIGYQMPMYKQDGPLVSFAAWKDHCSLYIMSTAVHDAHKADLKAYDSDGGTVRFPAGKPLPVALVKKLVKARLAENAAVSAERAAKKAAKRRAP